MRVLALTGHGPPDVLKVTWLRDKKPSPGEVRIAVKAAGVSTFDLAARAGLEPEAPKPPWGVLGCEVSGEIDSVGEGVEHFAPGQAVMALCPFGGYAELVIAGVGAVRLLPRDWTFAHGAAFPISYVTASWGLLRDRAVEARCRVLIHRAADAVGVAAAQIAKLKGAEVFGLAPARQHRALEDLGIDHALDERSVDFVAEVRRISGDTRPLDIVIAGAADHALRQSHSLLRPGGRLLCYCTGITTRKTVLNGLDAAATQPGGVFEHLRAHRQNARRLLEAMMPAYPFHPLRLAHESQSVVGLNALKLWAENPSVDDLIEPLSEWIAQGKVKPVVAKTFPLERGSEAHAFVQDQMNIGTVVLEL